MIDSTSSGPKSGKRAIFQLTNENYIAKTTNDEKRQSKASRNCEAMYKDRSDVRLIRDRFELDDRSLRINNSI
jgi:hypothetical protein